MDLIGLVNSLLTIDYILPYLSQHEKETLFTPKADVMLP